MNVKTIVTIALIGLLGVGTAAGIFLSDRSQQQEPPSADIQQEEKEEAPVESSSQKEEEQEQSSQETKQQQLAEGQTFSGGQIRQTKPDRDPDSGWMAV